MCGSMRSKISSRSEPVIVRPWFLSPMIACAGIGCLAHQLGHGLRQLRGAAGEVDLRRLDAVHPGVHVQDRADVGVLAVDHPVLDGVDRDAPRLDARRDRDLHRACLDVVVGHEHHVAPDVDEARLVDARGTHPETRVVLARRHVPVGEASQRVQAHDVAQVALRQDLLDRERCGQEVERIEALTGAAQRGSLLVAAPELGLEIGREHVVDHERRLGERREARGDRVAEGVVVALVHDRVVALLGCEEARFATGDDAHREVREGAYEHRVGVREEVLGNVALGPDRSHERRLGHAPEGARIGTVDEVDHEAGPFPVVEFLVATFEKRGAQPGGEGFEHVGHRAVEGELHRLCRLSVVRVPVPGPRDTLASCLTP